MGKFNRNDRPGGRGGFGGRRPDRQNMHPATCGECGNSCEIPFKPTGDRPVLCGQCFSKKRGDRYERSGGRDFGREKTMHVTVCDNCGDKCEVPFRPTSGKPVYCNKCFDKTGGSDKNKGGSKGNEQSNEQFITLNSKLDKILEFLTQAPAAKTKTAAKPKKSTPAKKADNKTVKKPTRKTTAKKKK